MKLPLALLLGPLLLCTTSATSTPPPRGAGAGAAGDAETEPGPLQTLYKTARKVVSAYVGGTPVIDTTERDAIDRRDGMTRLSEGNWEEEVGGWDGTWVIVIHGHANDPISLKFLESHTDATKLANEFLLGSATTTGGTNGDPDEHGDDQTQGSDLARQQRQRLDKVKWARLDYMTEWELCTRFLAFRPPYYLFVNDHGRDLRFLSQGNVRPSGKRLFNYVAKGDWDEIQPWESAFGPRGRFEPLMNTYITLHRRFSSATAGIPGVVWLLASGVITQLISGFLYRNRNRDPNHNGTRTGGAATAPTTARTTTPRTTAATTTTPMTETRSGRAGNALQPVRQGGAGGSGSAGPDTPRMGSRMSSGVDSGVREGTKRRKGHKA